MIDHLCEKELIIAAARSPIKTKRHKSVGELVTPSLDWNYILEKSLNHGIAPLLFQALAQSEVAKQIPNSSFETLRKIYLSSLLSNMNLYKKLVPVLDAFNKHSVPTMLLKGAALCLTTYKDMALRPFGDVDILVPHDKVHLCQGLMEELGYNLVTNNYFPIPDEQNDQLGCEWTYQCNGAVIELHWNLIDKLAPFPIDISSFWEGAEEVDVEGRRALVMSPHNQLIHLCLHQFKHHWNHIRDLTDVAVVIEKFDHRLDWELLYSVARAQGLSRSVYYTLALTNQVLDASIPDSLLAPLIKDSPPSRIATSTRNLIAGNILENHMPRRFWGLLLVDGTRNRLKLVGKIFAHPFPRSDDHMQPASRGDEPNNRIAQAIKSVFFYRRLTVEFMRYFVRNLRHP